MIPALDSEVPEPVDKILGHPAETHVHPPAEPVRVGRFEWERLMLMSSLPRATKGVLLALGVFMSEDGGDARPGLDNLAMATGRSRSVLIEHLAVAVAGGYLHVIERGGFRRKTARATEYAAVVPKQVWVDRDQVLRAPPWRRVRDVGSTSENPDVDRRHERPETRTLIDDEGPVSRDEGPVSTPPTSENPDPTTQLHHAPNTTSRPPVASQPWGGSLQGEGEGSTDQAPDEHHEQAARLAEPYASRMRSGQLVDLEAQLAAALGRGWPAARLEQELAFRHDGLNDMGSGLVARIRNLKQPPARPAPSAEPLPGEGEKCPLHHRNPARNCALCWGDVKAGQDPYARYPDLRPTWWHEVYRRPTRKPRQETPA